MAKTSHNRNVDENSLKQNITKKHKIIHNHKTRPVRSLFELCRNHDYITKFPKVADSELKKILEIHPKAATEKDTFGRTVRILNNFLS